MFANRRTGIALAALLAAAFASGPACAENTASPAGKGTQRTAGKDPTVSGAVAEPAAAAPAPEERALAAELLTINGRIALLSARLKEVELQASIAAKQRDLATGSTAGDAAYGSGLPVVHGIDGVGKRLKATLAWASGLAQTVGEGDSLPGGWRVAHIDLDTVELVRGAERVRLGFGSAPASPPQPQFAAPYAQRDPVSQAR